MEGFTSAANYKRKEKLMKKTLSLILAFVMLFSMLPAGVFAAVEVPPLSVTYKFYDKSLGGHSDVTEELEDKDGSPKNNTSYPSVSSDLDRMWAYLGTTINKSASTSGFLTLPTGTAYLSTAVANQNEWIAFKVKVPETAKYALSGKAYMYRNASKEMQIYLAPLTEELATLLEPSNQSTYGTCANTDESDKNFERSNQKLFSDSAFRTLDNSKVGEVSIYIAKNAQNEKTVQPFDASGLKELSLTEGEYVLLLNNGSETAGTLTVSEIALTVTEPSQAAFSAELSFDASPVFAGREAKASVAVTDENGKPFIGEYRIEYTSSDANVAEINADTGVITAKAAGTTTISAVVTAKDFTTTLTKGFEVTEPPVLSAFGVEKEPVGVIVGGTAEVIVSAFMSDGKPGKMSDYSDSVEYASADSTIAEISQDGIVTGVSVGETTITISAQNEKGAAIEKTVSVNVIEKAPDVVIDFKQTVVPDGAVTPSLTPGYELILDEMAAATFTPVAYPDGTKKLHKSTGNKSKPWPAYTRENDEYISNTVAFYVDIPYNGYYSMSVLGGLYNRGAEYSVFVDNTYMGEHSFYIEADKGITPDTEKTLNTVYLKAGKHKVYFRMRGAKDYKTTYVILDTITFSPVSCPELELEKLNAILPDEMAVGEISDSSVQGIMTDGSIHHFGITSAGTEDEKNAISTEITDESVVEMTGFSGYTIGKSGTHTYRLTAKEEGETTVTFTGVLGEDICSVSKNIKVTVDPVASVTAETEVAELLAGDVTTLIPHVFLESGREIVSPAVTTEFFSENEAVATVEGNVLKTHSEGTVKIRIVSEFNDKTVVGYAELEVLPEGMTDIEITAGGASHIRLTDKENDTVPLYVTAISNVGRELDTKNAVISAKALTPQFAVLDDNNNIIPVSAGNAEFEVSVTLGGHTVTETVTIPISPAKRKSTYFTEEEAKNARENISKYTFAKEEAESYIKNADSWLENIEYVYGSIVSEGIPRHNHIGHNDDPEAYNCRFCNADIRLKYGSYGWEVNALTRPWKIQCPDCKRLFPSNNFEEFYKLGLNEYGEFDRQRALDKHAEQFGDKTAPVGSDAWYGYGVKGGYLYNELYEDVDLAKIKTLNNGKGLRPGEKQETWGVDDGYGYAPKDENGVGYYPKKSDGSAYLDDNDKIIYERHTYIPYYIQAGLWYGFTSTCDIVTRALVDTSYAYFYTGDVKYGKAAALLLDRIADFYADYDLWPYFDMLGYANGKLLDRIWGTSHLEKIVRSYDMIYDVYEDPSVVAYIKEVSSKWKSRFAKETPSQLRTHVEDGIIRPTLDGLKNHKVFGNFGYHQKVNAICAVVLDSTPETAEWLEYLMRAGQGSGDKGTSSGGSINEWLLDKVDNDGQGNEGSGYNPKWHRALVEVQEVLEDYDAYTEANLFDNPKFIQMYYANIVNISAHYSPEIGDTNSTVSNQYWVDKNAMISGWKNIRDPLFAQMLYFLNGNTTEGLHYEITVKDPERLADEVEEVIDTYGELSWKSDIMTNFGFAILRDGKDFTNSANASSKDTRRDTWMYFGTSSGSHPHQDTLNLGMTAFGLNFMPDLGYPEATGSSVNRVQWVDTTLSHNTVWVNRKEQTENGEVRGKVKHFTDDGIVSLMDVSAPYVYPDKVSEYRRSVVQIHVDDENSYMVDFFRVQGGESHVYSLHATSNAIAGTKGLLLDPQDSTPGDFTLDEGGYKGSYAGSDIPYGDSTGTGAPNGTTWIKNIDRAISPEDEFEIDFVIKDFNKYLKDSKGLHLYATMLNRTNVKNGAKVNVAIGDGVPPQKAENKNIDKLKYVLVENKGTSLDTTFTTVFEPYRHNRFIDDVSELEMTVVDSGTPQSGDSARAIKVTHANGRVDYVFYSTNNTVTYEVTAANGEKISFRGFVGVYTIQNDENTYNYVHDGDIIGKPIENAKRAIEGEVVSFTKEHLEENEIVIAPANGAVTDEELENLAGRLVVVDNGAETRSGAFNIVGADRITGSDNICLDIGRITPIRQYVDPYKPEDGFIYMIAEGQSARIPLSINEDSSPVFDEISSGLSTSAGSSISVTVNAESPIENNPPKITYIGTTLPRGASVDSVSGKVTWRPDNSQIGENHFAITARDSDGRETTAHFTVTVYGKTTGNNAQTENKPSTEVTDTPAGGGGGGGGAAPAPDTGTDAPVGDDISDILQDEDKTDDGETAPDASGETDDIRFTDLSNHSWAADAINVLAADGIIKGTTASTFSPANNITRADFALLLVRAFKLTSDNTENFADVSASDYFAHELAIARNTGIVGGIGDNKFAPRSKITRQDMMVIVYRTLTTALEKMPSLPKGGGTAERRLEDSDGGGIFLSQYPDYAAVADYAKEAVSALIGAGLVNGKNENIAPLDYTTRAEVAVLIKRILDYVQ